MQRLALHNFKNLYRNYHSGNIFIPKIKKPDPQRDGSLVFSRGTTLFAQSNAEPLIEHKHAL